MVEVWVAHYVDSYEPGWIIGLYASAELARNACQAQERGRVIIWAPSEKDSRVFVGRLENPPGSYPRHRGMVLTKGYGYIVEPMEVRGG